MDITEFVADKLEDATVEELQNIIRNGVNVPDNDMQEALESEFYEQAKKKLKM